jgi:competence protein ComK
MDHPVVKNNYVLSRRTLAVIPRENHEYRTRILEQDSEINSKQSPIFLLNQTCIKYGSTFDGRRKSTRILLKTDKKIPIPVIPQLGVYMIPTAAAASKRCVWLSYYRIKEYKEHNEQTIIFFDDGSYLPIDTPKKSFQRQYFLAGQLVAQLNRELLFPELMKTCTYYGCDRKNK